MSDRTLKVGDTYPSLKGQATDENGLVDLTVAIEMDLHIVSGTDVIHGTPVPIDPPEADADGVHFWNWKYDWESTDTDIAGDYQVELRATWATGPPALVQHFPSHGYATITIEPSLG